MLENTEIAPANPSNKKEEERRNSINITLFPLENLEH